MKILTAFRVACLVTFGIFALSPADAGELVVGTTGPLFKRTGEADSADRFAQSFTAILTGRVTKIGVAVYPDSGAGVTLKVYAGTGESGTLLYTTPVDLSGIATVVGLDDYSFHSIPVDVPVVSGSAYTFVLSPASAFKIGYKEDVYNGGRMFFGDVPDSFYDLAFQLTFSASPSIGGAVAGQTVSDTGIVSPFQGLTVSDPGATLTATVAIDAAAKGVFTAESLAASGFSTSDGGATYTHASGTPAELQAAIRQLVFDPTNNRVAPGSTETTTFTVTVNDGIAAPVTNSTTTVVATSVNDAPLVGPGVFPLAGTDEDTTSAGTKIVAMFSGPGGLGYTDVDSESLAGIAVIARTGEGWQYSTTGSDGWTALGDVSDASALLLSGDTYIRYVPDGMDGETASFTFRAYDGSSGTRSTNGAWAWGNSSTRGGSSMYSNGTAQASITVVAVNDAPAFIGGGTVLTVNENSGATSIKTLLHASDPDGGQTLTWTQSAAPAHGTLTFMDATAMSGGGDITPGGTISYTPAANYAGADSFTVQVRDGTASTTRTINVTINIVATELRFTTQPSGSVSGAAFTGQPVVAATDSSGRVDTTFTGNVTLSVGSGVGSLSGTLVRPAVAGVATFTDIAYAATADQQAFTLTASNTAGLSNATSASVTSNVVATKLRFATQPAPLTMASTVTRTFTTAPVVQAVDAANVVDLAHATAIVLSLTKSDGTAAPGTVNNVSGSGDTDGSATTVTITPTNGTATFNGLSARYTNAAPSESLALHATSGLLAPADSTDIGCREDAAPIVTLMGARGTFTEGGPAVAIFPDSVVVTDADDETLAWASIRITQSFAAGEDVLSFTNDGEKMGNIVGSYDAANGTLLLTSAGATATLVKWQWALGSVKYANTSDKPSVALREVVFVVNDGFLSSSEAGARDFIAVVATNDAPTLSGGHCVLNGTNEDTLSPATAVSAVLTVPKGLTYADPDGSVASGIAVTATTGNGSWGYSTDGVTWSAMGTVTSTSALLLTSTTQIRYAPNGANGETATITFQGWDQTSGTPSTNATRGLADVSVNGGTTAFSTGIAQASLTVASVNDAPNLGFSAFTLPAVNEDAPASGTHGLSIPAGGVDVDTGALSGKAVIATVGRGRWQYTTNGTGWTDFGTVGPATALLLENGTSFRYVPDGRNGETASFTFRAWDQTAGGAPSISGTARYADASTNGGTSAFSDDTVDVTIVITPVNDAPTLAGGSVALTGTNENTVSAGKLVSTMLAGVTYADPDSSATAGIAITATTGRGGWQYSTDGVIWNGVGTVSSNSALLLTSTSHVRYAPNGSGGEAATITFRGWDQTSGSASTNVTRGLADASAKGGTTGFSTGAAQATIAVTAVDEPPPSTQSQTITFGALADTVLGQSMTLSASSSSGLPVTFSIQSGPATLSGRTLTTTGVGLVTVRAMQSGNSSYDPAPVVDRSFMVTAGLPPAPVVPPAIGGSATLTVPGSNPGLAYQWQRNGQSLAGATGATFTLSNVQPSSAGLYTYTAQTPGGVAGASEPVIVGPSTTEKIVGTGSQAGADIRHPNGNIYDQLLLEGSGASFTADAGQVTRMSFVDLSDDIVQVEFSGAGTLSLVMDNAPAGAPATNYNQPGVNYVRGNVGIVITGANETSNVSVFSVGRANAVNQSLFRDGVAYDGVANVAFIAIQSTNGKFGGVYTGNVEFFAAQGFTGLYAPGVSFAGPVNLGDIQAFDAAQPVLVVGSASNVRIAGGNLQQPNGAPIKVRGLTRVTMAPGQTSQGDALPAQTNQGVLQQDGIDVTDLIVAP